MSDSPIKATLKSGTGFDAPWLTVDAENPAELEQRLRGIIDSKVLETVHEAASLFQSVGTAAPLTQAAPQQQAPAEWAAQRQPAQQAPPQNQGWGQGQQAAPQQQGGPALHPEGKQCAQCGSVLAYKVVNRKSDGKQFKFWNCPNQRSRDDGHSSEFAN